MTCPCPTVTDRTPDGLTTTYPLHHEACAVGWQRVEGTA